MTPTAVPIDTGTRIESLYIGGSSREAVSGKSFEVRDPSSGELVGVASGGGQGDVRAAIDAAAEAFPLGARAPLMSGLPSFMRRTSS